MPKSKTPKAGDIVKVKWVDITSVASWEKPATIQMTDPLECTSVGFVVDIDEDILRICGTVALTGDPNVPLLNDSVIFPRAVVRSIEVLVSK